MRIRWFSLEATCFAKRCRLRARTATFMLADAMFNGNRNVLCDQQAEPRRVGDSLNNELQNPLINSRSVLS